MSTGSAAADIANVDGTAAKRLRSLSAPVHVEGCDARAGADGSKKKKRRRSARSASVKIRNAPVRLQHEWTFWFDEKAARGMKHVDYENSMKQVGTFSTVQDFWRYWNNIVDPTHFPANSNLRLFKSNIKPLWEDPANRDGGKWSFSSRQKGTSRQWMSLMLAAIGEQFTNGDDICGIVLSIRPKGDVISVWNANSKNSAAVEETTVHIQSLLSLPKPPEYRAHTGAIELNQHCQHQRHARRQSTGGAPQRPRHLRVASHGSAVGDLDAAGRLMRTPSAPSLHRRSDSVGRSAGRSALVSSSEGDSEGEYASGSSYMSSDGESDSTYGYSSEEGGDGAPAVTFNMPGIRHEADEVYSSEEEDAAARRRAGSGSADEDGGRRGESFSTSPFQKKREGYRKHRKTHSDSTHQRGRLVHSSAELGNANEPAAFSPQPHGPSLTTSAPATPTGGSGGGGRTQLARRKPHWKTHHRKAASAEDGSPSASAVPRHARVVSTMACAAGGAAAAARSSSPTLSPAQEPEEESGRAALTSSQQRAFTCAPPAPIYPPTPSGTIAFTVSRDKRRRYEAEAEEAEQAEDWLASSSVLLLSFVLIGFIVVILSSFLVAIVQLDESESIVLF